MEELVIKYFGLVGIVVFFVLAYTGVRSKSLAVEGIFVAVCIYGFIDIFNKIGKGLFG